MGNKFYRAFFAALLLALFFVPSLVFAQEEVQPDFDGQTQTADEQTPVNPEENIILFADSPSEVPAQIPGASSQSSLFLFVRMIIVLALVVLCIYGVMKFFKRGMTSSYTADPYLKKAASLTLSPGKAVHVITLDDSAFLIGVTDNAVNLIGKVENKELVDAMNLHAEEEAVREKPRDFSRLLDIFSNQRKHPRGVKNAGGANTRQKSFDESLDETAQIIKNQRARFSAFHAESESTEGNS